MKRGDICFANLDPTQGAETQKTRPVVIVSNDGANRAAALVTVLPITSNVSRIFPFEVKLLASDTGLSKDSKAMAQQVRTLDKRRLAKSVVGHVPADLMTQVDTALRLHLNL
jgi:mRNA interferase MazF